MGNAGERFPSRHAMTWRVHLTCNLESCRISEQRKHRTVFGEAHDAKDLTLKCLQLRTEVRIIAGRGGMETRGTAA